MKQQASVMIAFLAMALLASLMFNFHYYRKAENLQDRLEKYLPAAQQMELENLTLKQSIEYQEYQRQKEKFDTLGNSLIQRRREDTMVTPATPPIHYDVPPAVQQPPGNNDFRDLNKRY